MARRPRGTGFDSPEQMRAHTDANRAMDAYNAGYRRGFAGQPAASARYGNHPRFAEGYTDGRAAQTTSTEADMTSTATQNPVVSEVDITSVEGCEGWTLRIYANRMCDATNGIATTPGVDGRSPTWQTDLVAAIIATDVLADAVRSA